MLHFVDGGALAGVAVKTYLLETSRVVRLGPAERSFHTFHELLTPTLNLTLTLTLTLTL